MGTMFALILCVVIGFPLAFAGVSIFCVGVFGLCATTWQAVRDDNTANDQVPVQWAVFGPVTLIGAVIGVAGVMLVCFVLAVIGAAFDSLAGAM